MGFQDRIKLCDSDVLFVCESNMVISPFAEAIFNKLSSERNAFSAGLNTQSGGMPSFDMIKLAVDYDVNMFDFETRNIQDFHIECAGLVLASNSHVKDNLKSRYPDLEVFTIREYAGFPDSDINESVFWDYTDIENRFRKIYEAIVKITEKTPHKSAETGNFRYLDSLIQSDDFEIVLDSDIFLGENEEDAFLEGILIDRDGLVIDGDGHAIDAKSKSRIFRCTAKNITLKNIEFRNASAQRNGGAIYVDGGEIAISNSSFKGNSVFDEDLSVGEIFSERLEVKIWGGAIFNGEGRLSVSNCAFLNNSSNAGGAIFNDMGSLTITDSIFIENVAEMYGGAIFDGGGDLNIENSILLGNLGKINSGALYDESGNANISGSRFIVNSSNGGCGGIYVKYGTLNIKSSLLKTNVSPGNGGAVNTYEGIITIEDCELLANTAGRNGGAINNEKGFVDILNSNLSNNVAEMSGGAIYNSSDSRFFIENSSLCANSCKDFGSAIINYSYMKIFDSIFSNYGFSDDVVHNSDFLEIYNSRFNANHAKNVIVNDEDSTMSIYGGKFIENNAEISLLCHEGVFFTLERPTFKDNLSTPNSFNIINRSDFTLIFPKMEDGEVGILNEGSIHIKGRSHDFKSRLDGNGEVDFIGDIPKGEKFDFAFLDRKIHQSDKMEIILKEDITFEYYESYFYEGGIELDIDNLVIDGNGHSIDGGGRSRIFIITADNITLKNIIFKNGRSYKNYDNSINDRGGALRICPGTNVKIDNCRFINMTCNGNGGAIYNKGTLNIKGSDFSNCLAFNGAAIYNDESLGVLESVFSDNVSKRKGGAIYNSFKSKSRIDGSIFSHNNAVYGGAIFHSNKQAIHGCDFSRNSASREASAIYNDGNTRIINSTFSYNSAPHVHGILSRGGCLHVLDSDFFNDSSSWDDEIQNVWGKFTKLNCSLNGDFERIHFD